MKEISIQNFINNLKIDIPPEKEFLKLSQISPVNPKRNENSIINFERGMLLYALITKIKPKTVLEIGTAEGYSTLCMAWAMTENKIEGKIFTVDPKSHQQAIERRIKINENDEPINMILSTDELWNKFASQEWIDKIEVITGYSGEVLRSKQFPEIEFCYIEGSHAYEAVKHDFFAVLKLVSEKFCFLFNTYVPEVNGYVPKKTNGVKKVVDEEIMNIFETTLIITNSKKQRIELKSDTNDEAAMCYICSSSLKKSLWETFSKKEVDEFLRKYEFTVKRIKIRKQFDKKIPFLKNIRFRWWKK